MLGSHLEGRSKAGGGAPPQNPGSNCTELDSHIGTCALVGVTRGPMWICILDRVARRQDPAPPLRLDLVVTSAALLWGSRSVRLRISQAIYAASSVLPTSLNLSLIC
jgi:hypothetical protein